MNFKKGVLFLLVFIVSLNSTFAAFIEWDDIVDAFHGAFNVTGDPLADFLYLVVFFALFFVFFRSVELVYNRKVTYMGAEDGTRWGSFALAFLLTITSLIGIAKMGIIEDYPYVVAIISGVLLLIWAYKSIFGTSQGGFLHMLKVLGMILLIGFLALAGFDLLTNTSYLSGLIELLSDLISGFDIPWIDELGSVLLVIILLVLGYLVLFGLYRLFRRSPRRDYYGGGGGSSMGRDLFWGWMMSRGNRRGNQQQNQQQNITPSRTRGQPSARIQARGQGFAPFGPGGRYRGRRPKNTITGPMPGGGNFGP